MRHINIPIFIPHLGCPNQCIFCNQKHISGTVSFDEAEVEKIIIESLSTVTENDECEIAFFGGSFTGIDRNLMIRLLDIAQKYVDIGKVCGIRMSTRPDYINREIISILKSYTITYVELGIQSMNNDVLKHLKRGHTTIDSEKAMLLLQENNIKYVGQMMIGLPFATAEDEVNCAKAICEFGASAARIYPTLVFCNTELENMTSNGLYTPLTVSEAVERSAEVLTVFEENSVECIRIGLCESENLHSEASFVAGPNHPSIGEMVKSAFYRNKISNRLENMGLVKSVNIYCSKGKTSQIIGNKKENILFLKNKFGIEDIKVIEDLDLQSYDIKIEEMES